MRYAICTGLLCAGLNYTPLKAAEEQPARDHTNSQGNPHDLNTVSGREDFFWNDDWFQAGDFFWDDDQVYVPPVMKTSGTFAKTQKNSMSRLEAMEFELSQTRGWQDDSYSNQVRTKQEVFYDDATGENIANIHLIHGLMTDSFSWNASDTSTSENMSWDGLHSLLIGLGTDIHAFDNYTFSASWTTAIRFGGNVDASVNEPASPYSDISAEGEDGDFQNINVAAAYNKTYESGLVFSQRIGYRMSVQNYYIIDSNVTGPTLTSPSESLNSNLDTTWTGPYLGLSVKKQFSDSIIWKAGADVSFLVYEADGYLNLRPDLAQPRSMSQNGDGIGYDLNAAVTWRWMENWLIHGSLHYRQWSISGNDVRYPASGGAVVRNLNDATYSSIILGGAVSYVF